MSDQQKAEFQPVEPPESLRLLHEGAKTVSSAMMWTKDQEDQLSTHLSMVSETEQSLLCWLPTDFDAEAFSQKIVLRGSPEVFFSVSLPSANIFFKTKFLSFDRNSLTFALPEKIFKVQRRQNLRFTIPDGRIIKVQFSDPTGTDQKVIRKIHDLSAGGLAFLVEMSDEALYPKGLRIPDLSFTVNSRAIQAEAEVRHTSEAPLLSKASRARGIKVGVQFFNLKASDFQHIATFVFDENRRYFSKFF